MSIAISPLCVDVGSVRSTATLSVVGEDGNDYGDDPLADGWWESRPGVDDGPNIEWGLCGGSAMTGERADLSGRLPTGKAWVGSNFLHAAGMR